LAWSAGSGRSQPIAQGSGSGENGNGQQVEQGPRVSCWAEDMDPYGLRVVLVGRGEIHHEQRVVSGREGSLFVCRGLMCGGPEEASYLQTAAAGGNPRYGEDATWAEQSPAGRPATPWPLDCRQCQPADPSGL